MAKQKARLETADVQLAQRQDELHRIQDECGASEERVAQLTHEGWAAGPGGVLGGAFVTDCLWQCNRSRPRCAGCAVTWMWR